MNARMSMSVQCPKCQKGFKVAEEFAGRQATCPACKTPFRIPGAPPVAAPATAAARPAAAAPPAAAPKPTSGLKPPPAPVPQAQAAQRNSGLKPPLPPAAAPPPVQRTSGLKPGANNAPPARPPAPAAPQGTTIDFQCPWCDTTVKAGLELEGRQTPCPECKRIIKVPLQTKQKPKDWRNVNAGRPSGARRDEEAAPSGAWGTDAGTSTVSRAALEKAGLVEEEAEPASLGQRIKKIVLVAALVVAVGLVGWWIWTSISLNQRDKALAKVWASLETNTGREAMAEINRALGELYTEGGRPEAGRDYFRSARGFVSDRYDNPTQEREAVLIEVALGIIELGGDKEQVKNKTHLPWPDVLRELLRTIEQIRSPEARAEAIRRACARLMAKKQDPAEMVSGVPAADKAEALAIIGLERWRANQVDEAEAAAKRAQAEYDGAVKEAKEKKGPLPVAPSLVALYFLLKQPPEKIQALNPPSGDERTAFALGLGSVESQARLGQPEAVRSWANGQAQPLDKLRAYAVLAAVMLEKDPKSTEDLDTLLATLENVQPDQMVEPLPTGKPNVSWLMWRVVRLAALGGHDDKAKKLAEAIPDASLKGRAQLEILRARLERTTSKVEDTAADGVEKPALGPAKEILARHNTRYGGMSLKAVDSWPEDLKPFGWVGVALGIQDKEGR
jgi:hypothetical protein